MRLTLQRCSGAEAKPGYFFNGVPVDFHLRVLRPLLRQLLQKIAWTGQTRISAAVDAGLGVDVELGLASNSASSFLGWMQSTGHFHQAVSFVLTQGRHP